MSTKRDRHRTIPVNSSTDDSATEHTSKSFADTLRERIAELFPGEAQFITANRLGINPSYLSNILNLRVPPPSLEKVLAMAEVLQIDPVKLAALAGYISGTHPSLSPKRQREGCELSHALSSLYAADVSISLDDTMAMLLGKYFEIRATRGLEALVDFINSELVPGLSSRKSWEGPKGYTLRTYWNIGQGILSIINAVDKVNRNLEHLPRARGGDTSNPENHYHFPHTLHNPASKQAIGKNHTDTTSQTRDSRMPSDQSQVQRPGDQNDGPPPLAGASQCEEDDSVLSKNGS